MAGRAPLTPKQTIIFLVVLACLQTPVICFIVYVFQNPHNNIPPRLIGLFGCINLIVGVSLLWLITEKWIRKLDE
jgi:peptidoglycan/LPS O-acetylase OafA/YrhL